MLPHCHIPAHARAFAAARAGAAVTPAGVEATHMPRAASLGGLVATCFSINLVVISPPATKHCAL